MLSATAGTVLSTSTTVLPSSPPPHMQQAALLDVPSPRSSKPRTPRKSPALFDTKHGQRYHTFDREKAPYPLAYSKTVFELEALDLRFSSFTNSGAVSFVDYASEQWKSQSDSPTPERSLDLGCGTGVWVVEAAKHWPQCEFVGFDLMDVQIPLRSLPSEYASIAERVTWVHGNFLTNKLPFDDDEFDHVRISNISPGVPENKWGTLFEEVNRIMRPGGVVEVIEDDLIFPLLPKWFTGPLRARPRRSTSVHFPDGTHRGLYPFTDTPSDATHDHALLESLYKSVFESRFINLRPTAILPSYFTTYFRHVNQTPVASFFMPPIPPLQPLPPQIITSYVIDPNSDTLDSRTSTVFASPSEVRQPSLSFSSSSTTDSSHASSIFTGRRKSSSVSTYDSPAASQESAADKTAVDAEPKQPKSPTPVYVMDFGVDEAYLSTPERRGRRQQLDALNERSAAMHLYRSYQLVLACQEEMWVELKDRLWNRKEELKPFGWDDDEELEELQSRKKFELLVDRYRTDMQVRTSLWCSLTGLGWPFPPREPLSKAELIEEERIRAAMLDARTFAATDEEDNLPCRALRILSHLGLSLTTTPHTHPARPAAMIKIWSMKKNEDAAAKKKPKTSAAQIRVQKDLTELDLPSTMKTHFPDPADLLNFTLTITPDEGMYKGGAFVFSFAINTNYPHDPPKVKCTQTFVSAPQIYHPNVDLEGNVCLNILREDWKPVLNLNSVMVGLQYLFLEPNPDDPLNKEAAAEMSRNRDQFLSNVKASMRGQNIKGVQYAHVLVSGR
ncbi:UBIQUITIN-CONJUGAT-2 domain-containing protein [Mycena chlorophos]|uniref:NEDD8-conjugating enzyme UBC12 n=1 Tax=Mycena chlorophos TaxID=658473 RepID=A0A8H6T4Y1_MYCCL|nr:UBIQUITIN-CONJUGAT-2 domain-containing protein [Mycena chlorophos]